MNDLDIKTMLINALIGEFHVPVYLFGSLSDSDTYPADFFTFWNTSSNSGAFYDDDENMTVWEFELNFYSNDPTHTNSYLLQAKRLLKAQGWIIDGKGYDVASDEKTHTGRGINITFIEKEEKING